MSTQQAILQGQQLVVRPDFGRLYGMTHDARTKVPIIRVPRVLKVGIGISKGRAIQVFLFNDEWHIRHGQWEKSAGKEKLVMRTVYRGGQTINGVVMPNTKAAVEAWHHANKSKAAVSNRPQKIPYFGFTRRVITEEDGKPAEFFEPDFDAIEAHGNTPVRVPIIITTDNPLYLEYAWYTASELKCHGDGLLAERLVSIGTPKDTGWQQAKSAGQKMFLYTPCAATGCPHIGVDCKPHTIFSFQLANSLRLGSTAYYTSAGQVTSENMLSSLTEIRDLIERRGFSIAGIPVDMVLNSFKANFDGKPTMQPFVSLELRASGMAALRQILGDNAWTPMRLSAAPLQLADVEDGVYDAIPETDALMASAVADSAEAEFEDDMTAGTPTSTAATATQMKQEALSRKLEARRSSEPEPATTGVPAADDTLAPVEPAAEELF